MLTVGEILKSEREKQGLSLFQIEKKIKVREKFLRAIENNEWGNFSSRVYVSGIVKNYAKDLNLDQKKIIAFFRREYEKKDNVEFKTKIPNKYLTPGTRKIMFFGLAFLILLFSSYFGYQLKLYVSPPKVFIVSPKITTFKSEDKIKIVGQTEKEAAITIFGDRIYQNKEGIFEYDFPLKQGKNNLIIEVVGANGKKTVLMKEFIKE